MTELLYVHALTGTAAPPLTVGRRTIEFIDIDGVYAAVERLDAPPAISEAALREQHDIVLQIAAAVDALLPARFGSFSGLGELRQIVAVRRDTIRRALDLVHGREQMTIRIIGDTTAAPAVSIASAISGTQYLRARREAARMPLPPGVDLIRAAVQRVVASERVERSAGPVAATLYHLIERGTASKYRRALVPVEGQVGMTVSGPWPPFAFTPELLP